MKKSLNIFFLFLFSLSSYSQILPSHQANHYKSSLGAIQGVSATFTSCDAIRNIGPTQAQVDAEYLGTNLEGLVTSSSGIQLFTVPFSGTFTITAIGATGGNESQTTCEVAHPAKIIGEFNLTQGEVIKILVGQHGWKASCRPGWGGGGGTFVTKNDNTPLVVAGGCGGGHTGKSGTYSYQNASLTTTANRGTGNALAAATNGAGATGASGPGAAGLLGNGDVGNNAKYQPCAGVGNHTVPQAFVNGGVGDAHGGGFGGGGGVTNTWGGGGGGYSGGGGAKYGTPYTGGGGASYNGGANQVNALDTNDDNVEADGKVIISW